MKQYWLHEKPLTAKTAKNVINLFEQSGKLTLSLPTWTDANGEEKPGKTVGLDITALCEAEQSELEKAHMIFSYLLELVNERIEDTPL